MAEKSKLNIGEKFAVLEIATERPQTSHLKIRRVPNYLRNREHFAKHYSPKMVSMGPIHHGDPNLKQGEEYKLMWASKYIKNTAQTPLVLYKKIADKFEELKDLFTTDLFTDDKFSNYSSEGFANLEEKLCWMLFVDGCALLQILEKAKLDEPDQLNVKVYQLVLVMQDVLLLENQLPYAVLKLLWKDNNDESKLKDTMKEFLKCHHWATPNSDSSDKKQQDEREQKKNKGDIEGGDPQVSQVEAPTHLLDLLRKTQYEGAKMKKLNPIDHSNNITDMIKHNRYRNIQELREAGIRLKSSKTRSSRDISFQHGWFGAELTLPEIVVDDSTSAFFLNLIAYEMCPDFENDYEICYFAAFMDSLIDHPDDVKVLRSEGILHSSLVSDEEVATLFNIISIGLVPDMVKYANVRAQIDMHYRNKCKIWIAQGLHTYFSSPWNFIAFVAAFVALALTFVQTLFTINPKS